MRLNIFRNPFMDAQVGYFLDSMIDARRKETEAYWREVVTKEVLDRITNHIHANMCDDEECEICMGLELAIEVIHDEFSGGRDE